MSQPWFRPPRLWVGETAEEQPRHATWLELFYDLVFVVAVSQLAHELSDHVSVVGFLRFATLFVPLWWVWIGTTFYANRFDSDDVVRRVLMALQMLVVAAMAVNIHHGLGATSGNFALAYTMSRFLLVLEYLWAGWHIPRARGLTQHYAIGFGLGALLWLISVFVPLPFRFALWAAGLAIDFSTPTTAKALIQKLPPHPEHLPERFGLFTIIVLGEAIIAVVKGLTEIQWGLPSLLCAIAGFTIAFSLWWLYFENVSTSFLDHAQASGRLQLLQLWLYIHLPLVIGLAATGVGVEKGILAAGEGAPLHAPERWLLCGAVALCYLSLGALHRMGIIRMCKVRTRHRLAGTAVMLVLAIAGSQVSPMGVMALVALTGLVQVGLDLYQGNPVTYHKA